MGVSHTAYWLSWIIIGSGLSLVLALITVVVGKSLYSFYFERSFFGTLFLQFSGINLSFSSFAIVMGTLLNRTNTAYSATYLFIMLGLAAQSLISNVEIVGLLHSNKPSLWQTIANWVLPLYPPYTFSLIFLQIARITVPGFDLTEIRMFPGRDLNEYDIKNPLRGRTNITDMPFSVVS